jgi:hypothetical protein
MTERSIITEWPKRPVDLIYPLGHDRKCQGLCPVCGKPVDIDAFEGDLEWKEYQISGMCKSCQDYTFIGGHRIL